MGRFEQYFLWYLAGSLISVVGSALMITVKTNTSHVRVYVASFLMGGGSCLYVLGSYAVVQAKVPVERVSDATALVGCLQAGSQAISVALADCIFFNTAENGIQRILPGVSRTTLQAGITGARASILKSLPDEQRKMVVQAVLNAIKNVWVHCLATSILSVLLTSLMKRERMILST